MDKILVGVKRFTSKAGKNCEVMIIQSEFTPRMASDGCFGYNVEELFVPDNKVGFLKPGDIGHRIVIDYEISNGRAYMTGFNVLPDEK